MRHSLPKIKSVSLSERLRRGWFNRYRKEMPFLERCAKDIDWWWRRLSYRLRGPVNYLLVHPHYPSRGSALYKIARQNRWLITNRQPRHAVGAVFFEYLTEKKEKGVLSPLIGKLPILNLQVESINKVFIDEVHQTVFGYRTQIDWRTFNGLGVIKNRTNAKHDGRVVEFPLSENPGDEFICQRLIDNTTSDGKVLDYRVVVLKGQLILAYRKWRLQDERFTNQTRYAEIAELDALFSNEEQNLIIQFCQHLHLDYGELDVLRDQKDGLIYIVDVNDTPQGPPKGMEKNAADEAVGIMVQEFSLCLITESPSD